MYEKIKKSGSMFAVVACIITCSFFISAKTADASILSSIQDFFSNLFGKKETTVIQVPVKERSTTTQQVPTQSQTTSNTSQDPSTSLMASNPITNTSTTKVVTVQAPAQVIKEISTQYISSGITQEQLNDQLTGLRLNLLSQINSSNNTSTGNYTVPPNIVIPKVDLSTLNPSTLTVSGDSTFTNALFTGAITLASTTPADATSKLYNNGGSLYWNGSLVAGAAVGNWTSSGANVYRATGNVGIGNTNPTERLTVTGNILASGTINAGAITGTSFIGNGSQLTNITATNISNFGSPFYTFFHATTTDALAEGSTNKYYTDARVGNYLTASSTLASSLNYWNKNGSSVYYNGGNVGIGTNNPSAVLDVITTGKNVFTDINDVTKYGLLIKKLDNNDGQGTGLGFSNSSTGVVGASILFQRTGGGGGGDLVFNTKTPQTSGISEGMRLSSNGNLGIGTTNPNAKLDVNGIVNIGSGLTLRDVSSNADINSTSPYFRINAFNSGQIILGSGGGNVTVANSFAVQGTGNSSFAGNVGIGTTSPSGKLDINAGSITQFTVDGAYGGSTGVNGVSLRNTDAGSGWTRGYGFQAPNGTRVGTLGMVLTGNTPNYMYLADSEANYASPYMAFIPNGNVGISTTNPGAKLDVNATSGIGIRSSASVSNTVGSRQNLVLRNQAIDWYAMGIQANNGDFVIDYLDPLGGGASTANALTIQSGYGNGAGYVGIGTTSPSSKLSVVGNGYFTGNVTAANFINSGTILSTGGISAPFFTATNAAATSTFAGAVGIGTTNPNSKLQIVGSATGDLNALSVYNSSGTVSANSVSIYLGRGTASPTGAITSSNSVDNTFANGYLAFSTRNSESLLERMRIDSTGNVGIGTTVPVNTFSVNGGITSTGGAVSVPGIAGVSMFYDTATDSGNIVSVNNAVAWKPLNLKANSFSFVSTGTNQGLYQNSSGNVGIGTTTPTALLTVNSDNGSFGTYFNIIRQGSTVVSIDRNGFISAGGFGTSGYLYAGNNSSATAQNIALGESVNSNGSASVGIGANLTTSGTKSVAIGFNTSANGTYAQSLGTNLTNTGTNAVVIGNNFNSTMSDVVALGNGSQALTINTSGNVGIGTTSPDHTLNIHSSSNNIVQLKKIGYEEVSTFLGVGSGNGTAAYDSPILAFGGVTSGVINNPSGIAYGFALGYDSITGNLKVGRKAGGAWNDALSIGRADGNIGIGTTSPSSKLTVAGNIDASSYTINNDNAISFTNSQSTVRVGPNAGLAGGGAYSTLVGAYAGQYNTQNNNVIMGYFAGQGGSSADSVIIGNNSAQGALGSRIVAIGNFSAPTFNATGNTALGYGAGTYNAGVYTLLTGQNNTFLGYNTTFQGGSGSITNSTAVGANVNLTDSNTVILGNSANVGINTSAPYSLLSNATVSLAATMNDSAGGIGVSPQSILWGVNGIGYAQGINQASTDGIADGLLVKIAGTAASNKILSLNSNGVDRFTVNGAGNVGIGTTSPYAKLSISNTTNNLIPALVVKMGTGGTNAQEWQDDNGTRTAVVDGRGAGSFNMYGGNTSYGLSVRGKILLNGDPNDPNYFINVNGGMTQYQNYFGHQFTVNSSSNPTVAMTIAQSGNVGIGTTTPAAQLSVKGATNGAVLLGDAGFSGTFSAIGFGSSLNQNNYSMLGEGINTYVNAPSGGIISSRINNSPIFDLGAEGNVTLNGSTHARFINNSPGPFYLDNSNAQPIIFRTSSDEKMRVAANGNVGIGTTNPQAKLEVGGTSAQILISNSNTNASVLTIATPNNGNVDQNIMFQRGDGFAQFGFKSNNFGNYRAAITVQQYVASPVEALSILSDGSGIGNIGIGTTTPSSKLTVQGSACISAGPGATAACTTTAGHISAVSFDTANVDLAENYSASDQSITAGDIVSVDQNRDEAITKATQGSSVIGIVSTKPGMLLGANEKDTSLRAVALAGRVPVKFSTENGTIKRGDALTLSSQAGVAMKANGGDHVIGTALSEVSNGMVTVFVRSGMSSNISNTFAATNGTSSAQVITDHSGIADLIASNFSAAYASIKNLFVENLTVGSSAKPSGITLYDEVTGQPYCLKISNGATKSVAGTCESQTTAPAPVSTPTPLPIPTPTTTPEIQASSTPETTSDVVVTDTPAPSETASSTSITE